MVASVQAPKQRQDEPQLPRRTTKHGRYVNWREKRAKEKYYLGEVKRVLNEAREVGLLF